MPSPCRFLIKTVGHEEMRLLLEFIPRCEPARWPPPPPLLWLALCAQLARFRFLLPWLDTCPRSLPRLTCRQAAPCADYRHVQANPDTLLVHFYGVHRISPALGRQVRRMGNA